MPNFQFTQYKNLLDTAQWKCYNIKVTLNKYGGQLASEFGWKLRCRSRQVDLQISQACWRQVKKFASTHAGKGAVRRAVGLISGSLTGGAVYEEAIW